MTIREYLLENSVEEMPEWLRGWKPGAAAPLHDFLMSRIVFYPGAGLDGHAVKAFEGAAHCFVYADYGVSERDLERDLSGTGFLGYSVLESYPVMCEMIGELKHQREFLTGEEVSRGMSNWNRLGMDVRMPFMKLYILERKEGFGADHGPSRFAFLYMQMDAFAVYEALFANRNAYLWGMLLQDHGSGGNYDKFGRGGTLERLAKRSRVFPTFLLTADNTQAWIGYEAVADTTPECGGMGAHARHLLVRMKKSDASLSRISELAQRKDEFETRRQAAAFAYREKASASNVPVLPDPMPQVVLDAVLNDIGESLSRVRVAEERCDYRGVEPRHDAKKRAACKPARRKDSEMPRWMEGEELASLQRDLEDGCESYSFVKTIQDYVRRECGGNAALLYHSCGVSRSVYSQMISNPDRVPARETIIALAFGMRMDLDEASEFLHEAGMSFSENSKADRVFAVCFKHGCWNVMQVNQFLERKGVKRLLSCYFE